MASKLKPPADHTHTLSSGVETEPGRDLGLNMHDHPVRGRGATTGAETGVPHTHVFKNMETSGSNPLKD